jgi:hypothetical protein
MTMRQLHETVFLAKRRLKKATKLSDRLAPLANENEHG